jgi:hypothetical protein
MKKVVRRRHRRRGLPQQFERSEPFSFRGERCSFPAVWRKPATEEDTWAQVRSKRRGKG